VQGKLTTGTGVRAAGIWHTTSPFCCVRSAKGNGCVAQQGVWQQGVWQQGVWQQGVWQQAVWQQGVCRVREVHTTLLLCCQDGRCALLATLSRFWRYWCSYLLPALNCKHQQLVSTLCTDQSNDSAQSKRLHCQSSSLWIHVSWSPVYHACCRGAGVGAIADIYPPQLLK
jgi:hypothetical protein